jgi:CRP-like cAMP-binding protein
MAITNTAEKNVEEHYYKKGSLLWIENSKAMPYFFIIKSGQLKQTSRIMQSEEVVLLNSGDTFGLTECLTGHEYLSKMEAMLDTTVIMIRQGSVIPFLSAKPDIFLKIVSDYSNRLRKINQRLYALCSKSLYMELPDQLLDIAGYFKKKEFLSHSLLAYTRFAEYTDDTEKKKKAAEECTVLKQKGAKIARPEITTSRALYMKDQIIFLEQERGEDFYFIEKGKVKISHIDKEHEFVVAVLREGEFFGEMALLSQVARTATATAFEDTKLLILHRDTFMQQVAPQILNKIFTSLAKRIWYSYRRALNLGYSNPVTRLYDSLDLIIQSKEGRQKDISYYFDITFKDLRVMTNTMESSDAEIKEFLEDNNIRLNYGQIAIVNLSRFEDVHKLYLAREKTK